MRADKRNCNADKSGATGERSAPNACDAVGNGDRGQSGAAVERRPSDACDAVRDRDRGQPGAAVERILFNACGAVRDRDRGQSGASVERTLSDARDAVRDRDRGQFCAVGKGACRDRLDRDVVQRGGDDKRRDVLPEIVGDAGDRAAVVEREIALPAHRERQIAVVPQQVGDLRSPRVIPTEEDTVFPYRLAERNVVLYRVGRRVAALERSAVQIVGNRIGVDRPTR